MNNFYVITGGPGAGKTTLIKALERAGFLTFPEEARQIIKKQMQLNADGLPWKNKQIYASLMLQNSVKTYQDVKAKYQHQPVFFDRGILDTFGYCEMESLPVTSKMEAIARTHPYHKKVFILPPWEEIYETDTERKQTWKDAIVTFEKMKATYQKYGYKIIEVPKQSVENRVTFILKHQLH